MWNAWGIKIASIWMLYWSHESLKMHKRRKERTMNCKLYDFLKVHAKANALINLYLEMIYCLLSIWITRLLERNDNPNSTTLHIYGKPIHTVNGGNKRTKKKKQLLCVWSSFKGVIGWRLSSCSCRNLVSLLFLLSKLVWHLLQCHK